MNIRSLNPFHFETRYLISGLWLNATMALFLMLGIGCAYLIAIPFLQSLIHSQNEILVSASNLGPRQIKDLLEIQTALQKESYRSLTVILDSLAYIATAVTLICLYTCFLLFRAHRQIIKLESSGHSGVGVKSLEENH